MGGRQADADECYQFAEIGAVQDEEGNGWVCQNAWESFWIIASYAGSLLFFPRKTLCWVTHLEAMNLFTKEDPSFPLTCYVQDCVCPAEAAPVWRMLQSLPPSLASSDLTVKIPHSCTPLLPVLRAWKLRALFRAFLMQGPGIPGRDCMVCRSLNQMKEQDLFGFYNVNPFSAGQL